MPVAPAPLQASTDGRLQIVEVIFVLDERSRRLLEVAGRQADNLAAT